MHESKLPEEITEEVKAARAADHDKVCKVLEVPEESDVPAMIAIGKCGDVSDLPAEVQAREKISIRRPLENSIMEGKF